MAKEESIRDRLKAARAKLGLSQSQAAKAWGFNTYTLQQWERSRSNPRGLYLDKLEEILKKAGV